ncbi:MAG: UDP-N-acetylmuramate--L-alanine ligase [Acidimicrobiales bacterium]|nr:UDP-N-acetylmuramate--L-alanine ligase [Acidimicrobiales bacterium]
MTASAATPVDLTAPQRVHLVGIGGAGMSAIASVLAGMGHAVAGSDLKDSPGLDRLRSAGIEVLIGHDAAHLGDVDLVAKSTAIPERNPEIIAARDRGIPVLSRSDLMTAITACKRTVAVGGTHGKTTTSSMLALVLREAGLDPSFIIGGEVNEIGTGAAWRDEDLFVVEADESDGTFVELVRDGVIVTNLEPDHLETYGGFAELQAAFDRFVADAPGPRVVCVDDPDSAALAARHDVLTYGTAPSARYQIRNVDSHREGVAFDLVDTAGDAELGSISLAVPGVYNARNATAAVVTALAYGAPFDAAQRALARYAGVARRFEARGEAGGVTFIDDYAHLPTEVREVLRAGRSGAWDRVVCVFQPHRYSRTEQVGRDFGDAFGDADLVVITDIYAAGEAPRPGVSGKTIVDAVLDHAPGTAVAYLPHRADLVAYLSDRLRPGDLCLTLGAGDLTTVPDTVRDALGAAAASLVTAAN